MNSENFENQYKVSVVIPAYNAAEHVGRAIGSILKQTHPADEIIVVDDGSTDDTAEIVTSYGAKVNLIRQQNSGAGAARNAGINAASFKWIAFLDSDDEWFEDKLEKQMSLLKRNPELVWASANYFTCFCNENRRENRHDKTEGENLLAGNEFFENYFTAESQRLEGWTGTMLIRKDVLEQVGLFATDLCFSEEIDTWCYTEDTDTWWRIAHRFPNIGYTMEPLAIYHTQIENNLTSRSTVTKIISDLITRHLELSRQEGHFDKFIPCARRKLCYWARLLVRQNRLDEIPPLIAEFSDIFPFRFRAEMRLRTTFPRFGLIIFAIISTIKKVYRCICRPK